MKKINLESLLFSVILNAGLLSAIALGAFNIESNANLIILIIEVFLMFAIVLKNRSKIVKGKLKINLLSLYILFSILGLYFSTYLKFGFTYYNLIQLCFYCIIPFFATKMDFKIEHVLKYNMIISFLCLISMKSLFQYEYEGINQVSMGNAYSICIPVISAIMHFVFYRNNNHNKLFNLIYIYEGYLFVRLLMVANRGAIVELLVTFILIYISKFNGESEKKKVNWQYLAKIFFICFFAIFLIINLESILMSLYNFFNEVLKIDISFLKKSSLLISKDNLSNNRNDVYSISFELIRNNFFTGHGIRTFLYYTGIPWPHNLFLQLLFDGGILFSVMPFAIILHFSYTVIFSKARKKDTYISSLFIFLMVFPRLFISNDIWLTPYLWILISYGTKLLLIAKSINLYNGG